MYGRAVGDRQARSPECLAKKSWTLELHCVTRVRPVGCGALLWRAFRGNVALRLVGGESDLHIVCRDRLPWTVCRLSFGRSVIVRLVHVESTHLEHAACADLL